MKKVDKLRLMSKTDIPFPQAGLTVTQPSIYDISYAGEDYVMKGAKILLINKNSIDSEDKVALDNMTDFEILLKLIRDKDPNVKLTVSFAMLTLQLLFPNYKVDLTNDNQLRFTNISDSSDMHFVNKTNFQELQFIIGSVFCLNEDLEEMESYERMGEMAKKIAEKLKKRHQKLNSLKEKPEDEVESVFADIASILSIGNHMDINTIVQYSIYQLLDQFKRFQLKQAFDIDIIVLSNGGKLDREPTNWLEMSTTDKKGKST